mmetsp:Transcript_32179/g.90107  ORF Transcript_32179/g.90107 Transcript_32179/m.90107 type:complete len:201 (-) Transcript_32179:852-1454(-)
MSSDTKSWRPSSRVAATRRALTCSAGKKGYTTYSARISTSGWRNVCARGWNPTVPILLCAFMEARIAVSCSMVSSRSSSASCTAHSACSPPGALLRTLCSSSTPGMRRPMSASNALPRWNTSLRNSSPARNVGSLSSPPAPLVPSFCAASNSDFCARPRFVWMQARRKRTPSHASSHFCPGFKYLRLWSPGRTCLWMNAM